MAVVSDTLQVVFEGVDKSLSRTTQGIMGGFGKLGKAATAGIGIAAAAVTGLGAAAVGVGAKLVDLGSDAQETGSLIQTSLGESTARFNKELQQFATEANRSFFELQQGSATVIAMSKSMGATEEQAADMGVTFAQMASDLGSFFNRADADVFLDLQSALAGSTETLQKYGINVKASVLQQMALDQGFIKTATDTIPDLVKAQLIQQAIQEQAADAMGDAARTSDSWANSLRGLKGKITDAATEAGMKLIPALMPLVGIVGDFAQSIIPKLTEAFNTILPFIEAFGYGIQEAILALQEGDGIIGAITSLVWEMGYAFGLNEDQLITMRDTIKGWWEQLIGVKDAIVQFLQPVTQWIQENVTLKDLLIALAVVLAGVVLSAIISVVTALAPIILALGAVVAAVVLVRKVWEEDFMGIRTALETFWTETGQPIFETVREWLATNIPVAIQTLTDFWNNTLLPAIQGVWQFLSVDMMPVWEALGEVLGVAIPLVLEALAGIWENSFMPVIEAVWAFIQQSVIPIFEDWATGIGGVTGAIQRAVDWLKNLKEKLQNIELPDWMTPGSPTPWQLGLEGVRMEMEKLSQQTIPTFQTQLSGGGGSNRTNNVNQTWNIQTSALNVPSEQRAALAFATGGI